MGHAGRGMPEPPNSLCMDSIPPLTVFLWLLSAPELGGTDATTRCTSPQHNGPLCIWCWRQFNFIVWGHMSPHQRGWCFSKNVSLVNTWLGQKSELCNSLSPPSGLGKIQHEKTVSQVNGS